MKPFISKKAATTASLYIYVTQITGKLFVSYFQLMFPEDVI